MIGTVVRRWRRPGAHAVVAFAFLAVAIAMRATPVSALRVHEHGVEGSGRELTPCRPQAGRDRDVEARQKFLDHGSGEDGVVLDEQDPHGVVPVADGGPLEHFPPGTMEPTMHPWTARTG